MQSGYPFVELWTELNFKKSSFGVIDPDPDGIIYIGIMKRDYQENKLMISLNIWIQMDKRQEINCIYSLIDKIYHYHPPM